MIVDWHNYGFTLLQIGLQKQRQSAASATTRLVVAIARIYEGAREIRVFFGSKANKRPLFCAHAELFGSLAWRSFCVTRAMQSDLRKRCSIDAVVLYDAPPLRFRECVAVDERRQLRA